MAQELRACLGYMLDTLAVLVCTSRSLHDSCTATDNYWAVQPCTIHPAPCRALHSTTLRACPEYMMDMPGCVVGEVNAGEVDQIYALQACMEVFR